MTALAATFLFITALNATFFAFWMDMQANEPLTVRLHHRPELRNRRADLLVSGRSNAFNTSLAVETSANNERDNGSPPEDMKGFVSGEQREGESLGQ